MDSPAKTAQLHTKEMQEKYSEEIKRGIKRTIAYGTGVEPVVKTPKVGEAKNDIRIEVKDATTEEAIFDNYNIGICAVLNFASFMHPGGGFLHGSTTQEEMLCHHSYLYNILKEHKKFYDDNKNYYHGGLFDNRALYTPNVRFFLDGRERKYNVITCASPNRKFITNRYKITKKENLIALRSRIKFILDIAETNSVEHLILGAWGCGVYGQDAEDVARAFKWMLRKYDYHFKTITFAVPKGLNEYNYNCFEEFFGKD